MDNQKTIIPPNSKESEMMVLGCMLTSINSLNVGADALEDADFYYTEHKIVFHALKDAYKNDKPADMHLICEELKKQDKLKAAGGIAYITTLAQYAGTSAYIEEYVQIVKEKAILRSMINVSQIIEKKALDEPQNILLLLEESLNDLKSIESRFGNKLPIVSTKENWEKQKIFLNLHRGKDLIGLRTSKIQEFNQSLLGLRELILLAAAPNVGKTALTIQLSADVLKNEPEACIVYFSLEMPKEAIFRRMILHLSEMDFRTFVFGSGKGQEKGFFTQSELKRIEKAEKEITDFGERLQIVDSEICPFLDTRTVLNYVEAVKVKTSSKRVLIIVDYLQVWPNPHNYRFTSDIEADKWRIGEMKKIKDALNRDPVIVISEARKPSNNSDDWGGDLSDVMGSARGTYTPDIVMLLSQIQPKQLHSPT